MRAVSGHERGQAVTEYAVAVSVLAGVFFLPWLTLPGESERLSIFMLFVRAFDIYINSFHTVITLPIP